MRNFAFGWLAAAQMAGQIVQVSLKSVVEAAANVLNFQSFRFRSRFETNSVYVTAGADLLTAKNMPRLAFDSGEADDKIV